MPKLYTPKAFQNCDGVFVDDFQRATQAELDVEAWHRVWVAVLPSGAKELRNLAQEMRRNYGHDTMDSKLYDAIADGLEAKP